MQEIRLWELDGDVANALTVNSRLKTEAYFEDTLVATPNMLLEGVKLVGRQTPMASGRRLDLLGVDVKGDGRLVVFELKRDTLSRDAVGQVIEYASYLDSLDIETLTAHIAAESGKNEIERIEDFEEWYSKNGFEDLEELKPPRMVLVGLGVDQTTERMVRFLAQRGDVDISLLTFHAFDIRGKTILAKKVEVEPDSEFDGRSSATSVRKRRRFKDVVEHFEATQLVDDVTTVLRANWSESRVQIRGHRRYWGLRRADAFEPHADIHAWRKETISLVFYARAKHLCLDEFRERIEVEQIPYQTHDAHRDPWDDPSTQIHFHLTPQSWETHQESLTALIQAVYAAWQSREQSS